MLGMRPRPEGEQGATTRDLIARVKQEVDLRLVIADRLEDAMEFGRYTRARCLSPEHPDSAPSALYFADGCTCTACGWKADAIDVYRMFNPEASVRDAAQALLSGEYQLQGEPESREAARERRRELDPQLALRHHFALAANPDALARLEAMGFTRPAIQHFRLGYAHVRVALDPQRDRLDAANIEWYEGRPYQWQWRFSIPVFSGGRLPQMLYRKANPEDGGGKITMERGAGSHLYNADVLEGAEFVVVVEGWGDVVTLWQWGIPAVTSTNGAGHWNSQWTARLGTVKRLYLVGDADSAGEKMKARLLREMPWARPVALPHASGSKQDIRDLGLAGWRRPDFMRLLRQADFDAAWRTAKEV